LLISLGRWQLHRADEKRALFDSFAAGAGAAHPIDLNTPKLPRYSQVEADGHYDDSRQILIDNMVVAERAGYFVITPFALQGEDGCWSIAAGFLWPKPRRSAGHSGRRRCPAHPWPRRQFTQPRHSHGRAGPTRASFPRGGELPHASRYRATAERGALDLRRRLDPARSG